MINNLSFVCVYFFQTSAEAVPSRLTYDDDDDDDKGSEYELINDVNAQKLENEFKSSFGNLILSILFPILIILAIIGLKAVSK